MRVTWDASRLYVDGRPFFVHGMNLFLDARRLERNPRQIYAPPVGSRELVARIIPHLVELGVNTVRVWPTRVAGRHQCSLPAAALHDLAEHGLKLILNLPVNWNCKPRLPVLRDFLHRYSPREFPNILLYGISNETYHGLFSPTQYLRAVHHLVKAVADRPTLATNANLNFPPFTGSDVLGADYFLYRYSISRDTEGVADVGAVARMVLEDAIETYPAPVGLKMVRHFFPFVVRALQARARSRNVDPGYFRTQIWRNIKRARRVGKPLLVAEYGYTEDPAHARLIWPNLFLAHVAGHVWYNWINFDPDVDGRVENMALFAEFRRFVGRCRALFAR